MLDYNCRINLKWCYYRWLEYRLPRPLSNEYTNTFYDFKYIYRTATVSSKSIYTSVYKLKYKHVTQFTPNESYFKAVLDDVIVATIIAGEELKNCLQELHEIEYDQFFLRK